VGTTNYVYKTIDGGITWVDDTSNWPNWSVQNTISPSQLGNRMFPYVTDDGTVREDYAYR
jgi:hypothetical protein